jgi:hypothetical protein
VARKPQKLIIVVCDCMPSISSKAAVGGIARREVSWMTYLNYCGAWRKCWSLSGKVAHKGILDFIEDLPEEIEEGVRIAASAVCLRPAVVKGN